MTAPRPQAEYRVAVRFGDTVRTAGMTPRGDDGSLLAVGVVGDDVDVAHARELAALAARRAVAAAESCVPAGASAVPLEIVVYVNASAGFTGHSRVADGASEVLAAWSGGWLPARTAVGVTSLPGNAPVEVSLVAGIVPRDSEVSTMFRSVREV